MALLRAKLVWKCKCLEREKEDVQKIYAMLLENVLYHLINYHEHLDFIIMKQ